MKLVILGRDGVLNAMPATYIESPEHWEPLPGVLEAMARLHREGWRVVIVTHQPAVGHGALRMEALNRIHARLLEQVRQRGGEVEAIFVCPHGPESRCRCRPPLPGLFEEIAERLKINLSGTLVAVATEDELVAARAVGARAVRIADGVVDEVLSTFADLSQFSEALLGGRFVIMV